MDIFSRLNSDMNREFSAPENAFKPCSMDDIETIAKAKADANQGLAPQSNCPLYVETYSTEKSFNLIKGAK